MVSRLRLGKVIGVDQIPARWWQPVGGRGWDCETTLRPDSYRPLSQTGVYAEVCPPEGTRLAVFGQQPGWNGID